MERYDIKFSLMKRLYAKGFTRDIIIALYKFIDGIIRLPKPIEIEYKKELLNFEERHNMQYVSTIELLGIEQGIKQGRKQGLQETALRMFQKGQSVEMICDCTGLSKNEVIKIIKQSELA